MTPFSITFSCTGTKPQPWLAGLRRAFPQARVEVWQSGAAQADYAVVWHPHNHFLTSKPNSKASL